MKEIDWDKDPTPPLDDYRAMERKDNKLWWRVGCGHHLNLFDTAVDQYDTAMALVDAAKDLADRWDGGEEVGVEHVVACQDYACKTCVVIACAADLRALVRGNA